MRIPSTIGIIHEKDFVRIDAQNISYYVINREIYYFITTFMTNKNIDPISDDS